MSDYIGTQLGDYKIIEEIGSGGMGQVFLAENVHHHKRYALKVLPNELSKDANFRKRFFDEARVMSELDHLNIVRVHHIGEHEGIYYLVMDYVTGPEGKPRSLRDELKESPEGRIEPQKAHMWVAQIGEGLAYAHKRGVIHRDIKPGNVIITADRDVKITDFGLAKAIRSEFIFGRIHESLSLGEQPTVVDEKLQKEQIGDSLDIAKTIKATPTPRVAADSSGILGTYDYMSPEQREGGLVDERSDIYSLGVLIYRMLTGRRPVGMAKPPSHALASLSKQWDTITTRCLADKPEDRYSSVEAFLADLRKVAHGRSWLLVSAAVFLIIFVGLAVVMMLRPDSSTTMAKPERVLGSRKPEQPRKELGAKAEVLIKEVTAGPTASGATLADVVTIQTNTHNAYQRIESLDRGQGFAKLLEEVEVAKTNADKLFELKSYQDAKTCYEDLFAKCKAIEKLAQQRQSSLSLKRQAEQAREQAKQVNADIQANVLWDGAEAVFASARDNFEQTKFDEAEKLFSSASKRYEKATAYMIGTKELTQSKAEYEAQLKEYDIATLELYGGPKWAKVKAAVELVQTYASADDFDNAVGSYQHALLLLLPAYQEALFQKAGAHDNAKNAEIALSALEDLLNLDPNYDDALPLDYMICLEMSGSGAGIGMIVGTTAK